MKKTILYIVALAWSVVCGTGCSSDIASEDIPEVPELGYIFFYADANSRATLNTGTTLSNFGVLGYKYSNYWESESSTALPNVFEDVGHGYNQEVTLNGSLYQYTPQKAWEPGMRYSFFGYHPYVTEFPDNVKISASDYKGVPYIDYEVKSWNSHEGMTDILTAENIDATNQLSDEVDLTFKHRLCALEVKARNFNENVEIIRNLQISISNLKYNSIRIYLDPDVAPTLPAATTNAGSYVLTTEHTANNTTNAITLPAFDENNPSASGTPISVTEEDKRLILIPQEGGISGKIYFQLWNGTEWVDKDQEYEVTRDLLEGHFYSFILSFADDVVSITFVDSDQWDEKDIDIEFE